VAVVLNPPAAVGVLVIVIVTVVLGGTVPRVQFTVAVPLHPPCDEVTEFNVKVEGSVTFVCTSVAGDEPLLVIVIVVARFSPRTIGSGISLVVTSRSTLDEEFASVI